MSNNPGKKGKPAPWIKKAEAHRARALEEYRRAHHSAYDEWQNQRSKAGLQFQKEEDAKRPASWQAYDAMKASNKRLRQWDKKNPSPLSWDDFKRLEAEFDAQYSAPDFS